jgi:hypothetical protein
MLVGNMGAMMEGGMGQMMQMMGGGHAMTPFAHIEGRITFLKPNWLSAIRKRHSGTLLPTRCAPGRKHCANR